MFGNCVSRGLASPLPNARRQTASRSASLKSCSRALNYLNKYVHLYPSLLPPNHVPFQEHLSGDKFTLVMKPIECVYDAIQCSWSGTVFQWSRHESIKPPLCGSETNTCTGRLSCSVYMDSVCVSHGRQCQCRQCVQCY